MTVALPRLDLITARLKLADELKSVDEVATAMAGLDTTRRSPAALVYPAGLTAQPNTVATGLHRQRATFSFGVAVIVTRAGSAGGDGLAKWRPAIDAVLASLAGWRHPDASGTTDVGVGRLLPFDPDRSLIAWAQLFSMRVDLRQETPS